MPALTKLQLDHATKRLEEQQRAFIQRKMTPLGDEPEEIKYSDAEKTAFIRSGAAKLDSELDASSVLYGRAVGSLFAYPTTAAMAAAMAAAEEARNAWQIAARAIRDKADRIMQSVLDELIMSPDGKAALDRIAAAFE